MEDLIMKKLIMFLMVLAISVPASATIDDSAPPLWGNAGPRSTTVWQMESDPATDPPCEDGATGAEWRSDGTWADGVFTNPEIWCFAGVPSGSGTYATIRTQLQLSEGSGTPGGATFEFEDEAQWLGDIIPTVTDQGGGLWVIEGTGTFPEGGIICGLWTDSDDGDFQIEGIIMDILLHESEEPPSSTPRRSSCAGQVKQAIFVDSNDLPVYEPQDPCGPPALGPTEGQLLISLGWQPGEDLGYPNFTATVNVDPNEGDVPNEDFVFPDSIAVDGSVDLTFTQANWNQYQNVYVQATADLDREGDQSYPIELTVTIDIADPNFGNPTPVVVTDFVGVVDNDIPFVVALPSAIEGQLSENDPCVPYCFDVTLSHVPTDDVYLLVTRYSEYEILLEDMSVMDLPPLGAIVDPNRLKFTTENYDTPQEICLEARDDDELAEPWLEWVPGLITLNGLSDDIRYQSAEQGGELEETVIYFNVQDNECGAWGYNPMDFNQDCAVNLVDFAHFCVQWLACTDPQDPGCQHAEPL
jgi:hypothetical protein